MKGQPCIQLDKDLKTTQTILSKDRLDKTTSDKCKFVNPSLRIILIQAKQRFNNRITKIMLKEIRKNSRKTDAVSLFDPVLTAWQLCRNNTLQKLKQHSWKKLWTEICKGTSNKLCVGTVLFVLERFYIVGDVCLLHGGDLVRRILFLDRWAWDWRRLGRPYTTQRKANCDDSPTATTHVTTSFPQG